MPLEKATSVDEQQIGENCSADRLVAEVSRVARSLWPQKTAAFMATRAGVSPRAAEYWLKSRDRRKMYAHHLLGLLKSDEGFHFLEALMTSVPPAQRPAWWRGFARNASRAEIRRRQIALAAEIEAIEREEADQIDLEMRIAGRRP